MTSESILEDIATEQGWSVESKLTLALEYIENQNDNAAWKDFLLVAADEENRE